MIFETDTFETPFDAISTLGIKSYDASTILALYQRVNFQIDSLLKAVVNFNYKASARIGLPTPSYQMDTIIVYDASDPRFNESFINIFFWSYADQFNKVDHAIQTMIHRLKLDFASTTDLDQYWGNVLGVRRKANESDTNYRTRLATHIRIITSSGIIPNIRAVVDRITGYPNGSVIESFWPATLRLSWSSPEVAKVAYSKQSLLIDAMNRSIAAGVSWSTSYPYCEYQADFKKCYIETLGHDMDAAIAKRRGQVYHAAVGLWESGKQTYQGGSYLYGPAYVDYKAVARLISGGSQSYSLDAIIYHMYPFSRSSSYDSRAAIAKTNFRSHSMSVIISKPVIDVVQRSITISPQDLNLTKGGA